MQNTVRAILERIDTRPLETPDELAARLKRLGFPPREKITREDVELVRWFAQWASNGSPLVTDEKQDALHRLADKLSEHVWP
jgi:hypothetical protein